MRNLLVLAAAVALPAAAFGQVSPTVATTGPGLSGQVFADELLLNPAEDILADYLFIVDTDIVDWGNGDAISGMGIFGVVYDLEVADAFEVPGDYDITRVVMDYLNFFGGPYPPATDVLVEFFADAGGLPVEVPTHQMTGTTFTASGIYISWWGPCTRLEVTFGAGEVPLGAGTWWVAIVPVDTTSGGDWYYNARSSVIHFLDSTLRDGGTDHGSLYGGPYGGGYGFNDWRTGSSFGYPGTSSFLVAGEPGGPALTLRMSGSCPGSMTFTATGATPGGNVAFVYGPCGGSFKIPTGYPCTGTQMNVGGAGAGYKTAKADGGGTATLTANVPKAACGRYCVQALDVATCTTSNVVGPL